MLSNIFGIIRIPNRRHGVLDTGKSTKNKNPFKTTTKTAGTKSTARQGSPVINTLGSSNSLVYLALAIFFYINQV